MSYFSNKELKALDKEWNYFGQCHINEFLTVNFQKRYIHMFHYFITKCVEENSSKFNDSGMVLLSKYEAISDMKRELSVERIGDTHYYLGAKVPSNYLFSTHFIVSYDYNYPAPVVVMEVYLPEVDRIFPFTLTFDASKILTFEKNGIFSLKPVLKDSYPSIIFHEYANIFNGFEGVLLCILEAKIGHYTMQQAIDIMMRVGPNSWHPNLIRQYMQ